jgi:hypothetical protein
VTYNGIGQMTDAGASLRIAPLFETGDSRYVWLTDYKPSASASVSAPRLLRTKIAVKP